MSDPFQPCERYYRMSYNALRVFAETKYPFVVSTKGRIIAEPEYLELLKKCNCVVQISMVCSSYDKLEEGAPSFEERLEIARKVAPSVKRLIVRIQPYMHASWLSEVLATLEEHKISQLAIAAPLPTGEVFTGYFGMDTMDKALIATNIQADATMDVVCANGQRIQQAWEDNIEDSED